MLVVGLTLFTLPQFFARRGPVLLQFMLLVSVQSLCARAAFCPPEMLIPFLAGDKESWSVPQMAGTDLAQIEP